MPRAPRRAEQQHTWGGILGLSVALYGLGHPTSLAWTTASSTAMARCSALGQRRCYWHHFGISFGSIPNAVFVLGFVMVALQLGGPYRPPCGPAWGMSAHLPMRARVRWAVSSPCIASSSCSSPLPVARVGQRAVIVVGAHHSLFRHSYYEAWLSRVLGKPGGEHAALYMTLLPEEVHGLIQPPRGFVPAVVQFPGPQCSVARDGAAA